jgi:hypothetical protein
MSDVQNAIDRVFAAETAAELEKILLEEPLLFTPEADQILAKQEQSAQEKGNDDMVAAVSQLRGLLHSIAVVPDFDVPPLPGAQAAADLIHALIVAAPEAPIPQSALADVFFTVLDALRAHARKNNLDSALQNLGILDERIKAAGGRPAMPAADGQESLLSLLEQWVDSPTWFDSHDMLENHRMLISADTIAILSLLALGSRARGTPDDAEVLEQHVSILESARAGKLEDTYIKLITDEGENGSDEEE